MPASALQAAARTLGISARMVDARTIEEIPAAFESGRKWGVAGVNVLSSPFLNANRKEIIELAAKFKLPAIYQWPESAEDGGLIAYGPRLTADVSPNGRHGREDHQRNCPARHSSPAADQIALVINLRAAEALGITIPQSSASADQ